MAPEPVRIPEGTKASWISRRDSGTGTNSSQQGPPKPGVGRDYTSQPMWPKLSDSNNSVYQWQGSRKAAGWDDRSIQDSPISIKARSTMWWSCLQLRHLATHHVPSLNRMSSRRTTVYCLEIVAPTGWGRIDNTNWLLGKFHINNDSTRTEGHFCIFTVGIFTVGKIKQLYCSKKKAAVLHYTSINYKSRAQLKSKRKSRTPTHEQLLH
jgi:hypothetical protein